MDVRQRLVVVLRIRQRRNPALDEVRRTRSTAILSCQHKLIPPLCGASLPCRYQIFAPILALQLVNTFWSFLIWRILFRMATGQKATDVREEEEDREDAAAAQAAVSEPKKQR